eukprot:5919684-Pleurochrysis_carterae.AAC.1
MPVFVLDSVGKVACLAGIRAQSEPHWLPHADGPGEPHLPALSRKSVCALSDSNAVDGDGLVRERIHA